MQRGHQTFYGGILQHGMKYRLVQLLAILFSAKFFRWLILASALYSSTLFLIARDVHPLVLLQDEKLHLLLVSVLLSVMAGSFINQFYDREKDLIVRPVRTRIQQFIRLPYYFYFYIFLNAISILLVSLASFRMVFFIAIYQFLLWLYSHKVSKILVINNLLYVCVSLYPFFGAVIYFQRFDFTTGMLGLFLFLSLYFLDVFKDIYTRRADRYFGYRTLPNVWTMSGVIRFLMLILGINAFLSFLLSRIVPGNLGSYFLVAGIFQLILILYFFKFFRLAQGFWVVIGFRFLILSGIIVITLSGIQTYL